MAARIILYIVILLHFASCSTYNKSTKTQNISSEKTILVDVSPSTKDTLTNKTINEDLSPKNIIVGNVVFTNSYCGGAWAPKEITDSYRQEYPLINSTILLQETSGKSESIKVYTDSTGLIYADLKPGFYNCFMTEKLDQTMKCSFNPSCKIWLARNFGQLTIVEGQTSGYKILYHFGCNPCDPPRP